MPISVLLLEADGQGGDVDPVAVPVLLRAQEVQEVPGGRHLHSDLLQVSKCTKSKQIKMGK